MNIQKISKQLQGQADKAAPSFPGLRDVRAYIFSGGDNCVTLSGTTLSKPTRILCAHARNFEEATLDLARVIAQYEKDFPPSPEILIDEHDGFAVPAENTLGSE